MLLSLVLFVSQISLAESRLGNLSARGFVDIDIDDEVLIGGFIITGNDQKNHNNKHTWPSIDRRRCHWSIKQSYSRFICWAEVADKTASAKQDEETAILLNC